MHQGDGHQHRNRVYPRSILQEWALQIDVKEYTNSRGLDFCYDQGTLIKRNHTLIFFECSKYHGVRIAW